MKIERANGVVEVYAPVKQEKTARLAPALDLAPCNSHQSHVTSEENNNSYYDHGFSSAVDQDRFATPEYR